MQEEKTNKITGRFSKSQKQRFAQYSASLGLHQTQLANLLALRAVELRGQLDLRHDAEPGDSQIYAKFQLLSQEEAFKSLADELGYRPAELICRIIINELRFKWLRSAVSR